MGKIIDHFLSGAGSVLQLLPSSPGLIKRPDFLRQSTGQRIGSDWNRVGNHLFRAIESETQSVSKHGKAQ